MCPAWLGGVSSSTGAWRDVDMHVDVRVRRSGRERRERVGIYHGQQGSPVERQVARTPFDFDELGLAVGIEPEADAWSTPEGVGRSPARIDAQSLPDQPL